MAASTPIPLKAKSQASFIAYYKSVQNLQNYTRSESRSRLERIDKQYQREVDYTEEQQRAKAANNQGDPSRFQNMVVPIIMPQVEASVTYQTSVYLTGHPLFAVVSSPAFIGEAKQMESVIEDESIRGGWTRELMLFFRDGFKHNVSFLEVDWSDEVSYSVESAVVTPSTPDGSAVAGTPKEVIWSGNRVRRLDPYNTFVDERVPPAEVYKRGEFAGYTKFMSRIELKSFIATLPDKLVANIKPAFESGTGTMAGATDSGAMNYYTPDVNVNVNDESAKHNGTNWLSWAKLESDKKDPIQYKDGYELTTLYCRVLPSEFDLKVPMANTPQIYKLYIVNHEHILYAELQTNAHNYLPILCGQPLEDGLGYQTKSLAENAEPFQQLATSYMTSIIASRRRAVTDRVLYDPSRITSAHINSSNPSAKIPVRPAAYGKNIADAVYQFPYREDQASSSMQQIQSVIGLANGLAGQNQAQQGQFVKGNKTLSEFESVMQNANGRDQLVSILYEAQVFVPMKHILKLNILQYQGGTKIFDRESETEVEIDPVALRKAVIEFKVSDGLIPANKLINSDTLGIALQALSSNPQLGGGYNIAQLFSYLMKTQGAEIGAFEKSAEQQAYEQAANQWQQVSMQAVEAGMDPEKLPPMPLPEAFGYQPNKNKPAPKEQQNDVPT